MGGRAGLADDTQSERLLGAEVAARVARQAGHLGSLQYLSLTSCSGLSSLPEWMGGLGSLQALYLRFCSGLSSLPESLGRLGSLQTLNMRGCSGLSSLPESVGGLGSLQDLILDRWGGLGDGGGTDSTVESRLQTRDCTV